LLGHGSLFSDRLETSTFAAAGFESPVEVSINRSGPPVGIPPLNAATVQPQYGLIHFGLRTDDLEKSGG